MKHIFLPDKLYFKKTPIFASVVWLLIHCQSSSSSWLWHKLSIVCPCVSPPCQFDFIFLAFIVITHCHKYKAMINLFLLFFRNTFLVAFIFIKYLQIKQGWSLHPFFLTKHFDPYQVIMVLSYSGSFMLKYEVRKLLIRFGKTEEPKVTLLFYSLYVFKAC